MQLQKVTSGRGSFVRNGMDSQPLRQNCGYSCKGEHTKIATNRLFLPKISPSFQLKRNYRLVLWVFLVKKLIPTLADQFLIILLKSNHFAFHSISISDLKIASAPVFPYFEMLMGTTFLCYGPYSVDDARLGFVPLCVLLREAIF